MFIVNSRKSRISSNNHEIKLRFSLRRRRKLSRLNRNKSLVTNKEKDGFQGNPSFNQTTMEEKGKGRRKRKMKEKREETKI